MKRLLVAGLVGLAVLVSSQPLASADTEVIACAQTEQWAFSPALTLSTVSGTWNWSTGTGLCGNVGVESNPIGLHERLIQQPASGANPYFGSCILALAQRGSTLTFIIGGTVAVVTDVRDGRTFAQALVGVPSPGPCNESSATAVGVGVDVLQ